MNYEEFNALVQVLDPMIDQEPIQVRRASLTNMENAVDGATARNNRFFNGQPVVNLSREDVFNACAGDDMERGLLSVLYWGFPSNQHGICGNVLREYDRVEHMMRDYRNRNLTHDDYEQLVEQVFRHVTGCNVSTFSKYLYFCNVKLDGNPCVILDRVVRSTIENCLSNEHEFDGLRAAAHLYNTDSYEAYWQYVAAVAALAPHENGIVRSDKVEYVLWAR